MSALTLNDLIVRQAPLLRAVQADPVATPGDLAQTLGRDRSNTRRDLQSMIDAGHLIRDGVGALILSAYAEEQLAAIARAESGEGEPGLSPSDPLALSLFHAQILPDPDNARRDWSSQDARLDLMALRMDIVEHGLHQNLLVRPMTAEEVEAATLDCAQDAALSEGLPLYRLVAGERRWRAIGEAMDEGDWPIRRPIPCRLLEADALGLRIAALSENLQRRDLNPIEKAQGFEGLATEGGLSNAEIADRFNKTPEHVQQHRAFLRLPEADQVRMTLSRDDPDRLTVRQARDRIAALNRAETEAKAGPPELDVSPIERLIAAELLHAIHRRADYTYSDIEVGPEAATDVYMEALVAANLFKAPVLRAHGPMRGRWVTSIVYGFPFPAFPTLRAGEPEDFDAGLKVERERLEAVAGEKAEVTPERPYVTAWLNEPFAITPEGQALIDAAEAEARDREAQAAEAADRRAAVEAAQAAVVARARALFTETRAATVAGRVGTEVMQEIATSAEAPLPWRVSADGGVVAADGSPIIGGGGTDRGEARMRLLVLAVNAAAHLETPEDEEAEPDQDIDGNDPDAEPDPSVYDYDDQDDGEGDPPQVALSAIGEG